MTALGVLKRARTRLRRRRDGLIVLSIRAGGGFRIRCTDGYQSRQEATTHLLLEAVKTISHDLKPGRSVRVWTTDRPPERPRRPVLAYSAPEGARNVVAVPDFTVWNWPDVGIDDYTRVCERIVEAGAEPPVDPRLFWIGNVATSPHRQRLMDVAAGDPRIHAVAIQWVKEDRPEHRPSETAMSTRDANHLSLPDHCRHAYLLDVEGVGYSARLKFLLFSRRPVFLQDRPWREFYFDRMEPFRHYIPVRRDLSDLSERLDWAQAHPEECAAIADQALEFARQHLTREAAILHLRGVLRRLLA